MCYHNDTRFAFECYDIGHLYNLAHFIESGSVKPPFFAQSVFGILGGIGTHPEDVMHMTRTADRLFGTDYRWSTLGGNVRLGLEDSPWAGRGRLATSSADQVRLVRGIIEGLGLEIASPDEARAILSLKGADQVAF